MDLPVCPPDSPLVPRGCNESSSQRFFKAGKPSLVQPGKSMCTEALIPETQIAQGISSSELPIHIKRSTNLNFLNAIQLTQ